MAPPCVAVVCHPHPRYGGTLRNKVVSRVAKAALQVNVPALRFNFRGVGKSQGTFAGGVGECEDVRATLDYLQVRFPGVPICLMGFSFGAWVGLTVGASDPRVGALVGLGIPVATFDFSFLRGISKPKLIIQGTRDEFAPRDQVQSLYDSLAEPKQLHWVQGGDHFFTGQLAEVQAVVREFLLGIRPRDSSAENSLGAGGDLV